MWLPVISKQHMLLPQYDFWLLWNGKQNSAKWQQLKKHVHAASGKNKAPLSLFNWFQALTQRYISSGYWWLAYVLSCHIYTKYEHYYSSRILKWELRVLVYLGIVCSMSLRKIFKICTPSNQSIKSPEIDPQAVLMEIYKAIKLMVGG